jgi:hypothetical protein
VLIPFGSNDDRRPVTVNAAAERSISMSPSMRQNRRNDRNAATKYCPAPDRPGRAFGQHGPRDISRDHRAEVTVSGIPGDEPASACHIRRHRR